LRAVSSERIAAIPRLNIAVIDSVGAGDVCSLAQIEMVDMKPTSSAISVVAEARSSAPPLGPLPPAWKWRNSQLVVFLPNMKQRLPAYHLSNVANPPDVHENRRGAYASFPGGAGLAPRDGPFLRRVTSIPDGLG
jgi:hypothetical protein